MGVGNYQGVDWYKAWKHGSFCCLEHFFTFFSVNFLSMIGNAKGGVLLWFQKEEESKRSRMVDIK